MDDVAEAFGRLDLPTLSVSNISLFVANLFYPTSFKHDANSDAVPLECLGLCRNPDGLVRLPIAWGACWTTPQSMICRARSTISGSSSSSAPTRSHKSRRQQTTSGAKLSNCLVLGWICGSVLAWPSRACLLQVACEVRFQRVGHDHPSGMRELAFVPTPAGRYNLNAARLCR